MAYTIQPPLLCPLRRPLCSFWNDLSGQVNILEMLWVIGRDTGWQAKAHCTWEMKVTHVEIIVHTIVLIGVPIIS